MASQRQTSLSSGQCAAFAELGVLVVLASLVTRAEQAGKAAAPC